MNAMSARLERVFLLATPAITVVVIALGLRMGASGDVRAAIVYGAPPSATRRGLAWTVVLGREDRGVREPVAGESLIVTAEMQGARSARWEGSTNADGVVEAWLALRGAAPGDAVALDVVSARSSAVLARGTARVPEAYTRHSATAGGEPLSANAANDVRTRLAPPTRSTGDIELDLLVAGGALAAEFPSRVLVQARDRHTAQPLAGVRIGVEPEPGLEVVPRAAVTCEGGWAELSATARAHVVGAALSAHDAKGRSGEWFGALPVRGGALFVAVPSILAPETPRELVVRSPTPRPFAYVEVDDTKGRAFAQIVDLRLEPSGMRSGRIELPPLLPGNAFVVASGEVHGATTLSGATMAFPALVAVPPGDRTPPLRECELLHEVVHTLTDPGVERFARPIVLDGFVPVHASAARARRRGLGLALWTTLLAALLETLFLVRHARRGRIALEALPPGLLEGRVGTVAAGLGIALLGFALLAALLLHSSS